MEKECYKRTEPCTTCPYRKDAPLQLWSIYEFKKLLKHDKDFFGAIYGCHKKDGHTCVGWLIDQEKRGLPSLALRIDLGKNGVTREYLESLQPLGEHYRSIEEMVYANYPLVFERLNSLKK
jgi:hypothetical protein